MRAKRCPFCTMSFSGKNGKHRFCHHIATKHSEQIPPAFEPLEFAYSLLTGQPIGRLCRECRTNPTNFNTTTLKYEPMCKDPKCKEKYVKTMKARMTNVHGKEHLLNEADMQRKMIYNHKNAKDYIWEYKGEKHVFRIIGNLEKDFLDKLRFLCWSPADIICPSPNNYYYTWPDGSEHLYIPDFFIPSLSLEVEIKDGFDGAIPGREHNREIEQLKDRKMQSVTDKTALNYIKIVGKNYDEFVEEYIKTTTNTPVQVQESVIYEWSPRLPFRGSSKRLDRKFETEFSKMIKVEDDRETNTFHVKLPKLYLKNLNAIADLFDSMNMKPEDILNKIYEFVHKWFGTNEYVKHTKKALAAAGIGASVAALNPLPLIMTSAVAAHSFMKGYSLHLVIKEILLKTLLPDDVKAPSFGPDFAVEMMFKSYKQILEHLNPESFRSKVMPWLSFSVFNDPKKEYRYHKYAPLVDGMGSLLEFNRPIAWDRMLALHDCDIVVTVYDENEQVEDDGG